MRGPIASHPMRFAFAICAAAFTAPGCHSYPSAKEIWGAPEPSYLPPGDNAFDCDAAENATSEWSQKIDSSGHVRGGLAFVRVRRYGTSEPSARITLVAANGAMAQLYVTPKQSSGMLQPSVRRYAPPDSNNAVQMVMMQPRSPRGIAFELAWTDSVARLRLDSNAPWLDVPMTAKPYRLILKCSAGEAIFYSVTVDKPSPPPAPTPAAQP
jgi:hypothetical protein